MRKNEGGAIAGIGADRKLSPTTPREVSAFLRLRSDGGLDEVVQNAAPKLLSDSVLVQMVRTYPESVGAVIQRSDLSTKQMKLIGELVAEEISYALRGANRSSPVSLNYLFDAFRFLAENYNVIEKEAVSRIVSALEDANKGRQIKPLFDRIDDWIQDTKKFTPRLLVARYKYRKQFGKVGEGRGLPFNVQRNTGILLLQYPYLESKELEVAAEGAQKEIGNAGDWMPLYVKHPQADHKKILEIAVDERLSHVTARALLDLKDFWNNERVQAFREMLQSSPDVEVLKRASTTVVGEFACEVLWLYCDNTEEAASALKRLAEMNGPRAREALDKRPERLTALSKDRLQDLLMAGDKEFRVRVIMGVAEREGGPALVEKLAVEENAGDEKEVETHSQQTSRRKQR